MRIRLVLGPLGLVAFLGGSFGLSLLSASCSSGGGATASGASEGGTPAAGDGGGDAAGGGEGGTPNDCKLEALAGVATVKPTFLTYDDPPGTAPPPMTGGAIGGTYKVDKAIVFLPAATKGLADPAQATGTVNAWAIFSGKNYRLFLKANFSIASVVGPKSQTNDVVSQGGFTATAAALTLDYACDATPPPDAEYTFTDDGSGRATILIKVPSTFGDTYLQLDAAKSN